MSNSSTSVPSHYQMYSNKIDNHHLDRLAIVYVRQSTMQQVEEHQESTRLQYALADKAIQMGWPSSRVRVIDQDLGCSGSSIDGRIGFQELMAEVALGHVGIVLGREVSRLARSSLDWQRLLETCAIFATLIGDQDGLYDPTTYNDRLLLGLKGSMSEAELHLLKQRMLEGRWEKARRGELQIPVPRGYFTTATGEVIKDPDERVRLVIETIFTVFERTLSIGGVLKYLIKNKMKIPSRITSGERKGELEWYRPSRSAIDNLLHHPIYAGAYVYGRKLTDPRKKVPGHRYSGRYRVPLEQCEVLIKDRLPAYISWMQFEQNMKQISSNQTKAKGPTRTGYSLLSGLLRCGHCGLKMTTHYGNNGQGLRYMCVKQAVNYGGSRCQSILGKTLDTVIKEQVFKALEPAALEISLQVANDIEQEQKRLTEHWQQKLEEAKFNTERAYRQYNAVEPENRLVARTLEGKWEETLAEEEQLKIEFEKFSTQQRQVLAQQEQEYIRALAQDIPAIWSADTTTQEDRQQIVRLLIDEILVTVINNSEEVALEIAWQGGHATMMTITRPVAHFNQLSCYDELLKRIKTLYQQGKSKADIALILNNEQWPTPRKGSQYTVKTVGKLLTRMGIETVTGIWRFAEEIPHEEDEWTVSELSHKIGFAPNTIQQWAKEGKVDGRKVEIRGFQVWLIKANKAEIAKLTRKDN